MDNVEFRNGTVSDLIRLIRTSKDVYCWCNWHDFDGDYFIVTKNYATALLKKHYIGKDIQPKYHTDNGNLYIG